MRRKCTYVISGQWVDFSFPIYIPYSFPFFTVTNSVTINSMMQKSLSKFLNTSSGQIPEKELLNIKKKKKGTFYLNATAKLVSRKSIPMFVTISISEKTQQTVYSQSFHLKIKSGQASWLKLVIPAFWEVKMGGLLQARPSRPVWATQ